MYLRLAFAVAAHLEPDVLVVDEILAVGDAEFQRKCIGRMQEAEQEGRTLVFVSHDLESLTRLCPRPSGWTVVRSVTVGPTPDVVRQYLQRAVPGRGWAARDTASRPVTCSCTGVVRSGDPAGGPRVGGVLLRTDRWPSRSSSRWSRSCPAWISRCI